MKLELSSGLFTVDQLLEADVCELLEKGKFYKKRFARGQDKKVGGLSGLRMINMFFEPSTRTRISFEAAAKSMGMLVSNIIADASAMSKGETAIDTLLTINAMNFDVIIIRTDKANLPYELSRYSKSAIINAGDGSNEHPTQALLDLFTIDERGFPIGKGHSVAIVGDLIHSRVAKSNTKLLLAMGYKVILVSPLHWAPDPKEWGIDGYDNYICSNGLDSIKDADVVMTLRIQTERFSDIHRGKIDPTKYNEQYGIKEGTLTKNQVLMHPGPVNRGVEIDESVLYNSQSAILDQVENGVAVRAAILEKILRG